MQVMDAPFPSLAKGQLLVRNYYSLTSAGTEGSTVKAKGKPKQVKQVIERLKTQGPVQTYSAVMKKLDAHSPIDGEHGFMTESKDPQVIASLIEKIILNKELWKRMIVNVHQYARERFMASQVAKRLEDIYMKTINAV